MDVFTLYCIKISRVFDRKLSSLSDATLLYHNAESFAAPLLVCMVRIFDLNAMRLSFGKGLYHVSPQEAGTSFSRNKTIMY